MLMISGAGLVQCRPFSRLKALCAPSPSEVAEELRQQLDGLLEEEVAARAKANSSRLRFMRLSEAVEKLRRQAAYSVRKGKENDAREALFQKRKVMQVMEKLKSRIETLDELSTKLNEAISMKEGLLIQNMALELDVSDAEAPSPVRIISPTDRDPSCSDDDTQVHQADIIFTDDQESDTSNDGEPLTELSPYTDFIEHLDQQLKKMEEEVVAYLGKPSSIIMENRENQGCPDTLIATEILQSILHLRKRIAAFGETTKVQA